MSTPNRKLDHLMLAVKKEVEYEEGNWFDEVVLIHEAAPSWDLEDVDLSSEFLGMKISAPLLIEGMTGGHRAAAEVNRSLARAAAEVGVPVGVGSQRAAIEDPDLEWTFRVVSDEAGGKVPIIANIGGTHARLDDGITLAERAVSMLEADALAIHLNALQECVQPEGRPNFSGLLTAVADISSSLEVPLIVKETGSGMSRQTAINLERAGAAGIDVGGLGGTNWAKIESFRGKKGPLRGENFFGWGIPSVVSVLEVGGALRRSFLIASGGVRDGVAAAKAIALGANYAGAALPFLRAHFSGGWKAVKGLLLSFLEEMRVATYLSGSRTPEELRLRRRFVLLGRAAAWAASRGLSKTFNPASIAQPGE